MITFLIVSFVIFLFLCCALAITGAFIFAFLDIAVFVLIMYGLIKLFKPKWR